MSFCTLSVIEKHCAAAAAGLRSLTLFVPDEVNVLPVWGSGAYSAQEPEVADGKTSYLINFDKFTASLDSRPAQGPGGDFWNHRIRLTLRKNRKEIGRQLRKMQNRRFHLITEDFYGVRMWFPNMRLSASRSHGERLSDRNVFDFDFSRRWNHPGVYLPNGEDFIAEQETPDGPWTGDGGAWGGDDGDWTGIGGGE